ncbi:MAG TPA: sulfotransferase domain-containing protein [Marmoricola sp.]|nr:sulfotransferase domain-containing protein [Marmoricola sp.]
MSEARGRLPNFLYIGPDKAGSSWLHEVLLTHPQIFLSEAKDLYFFDRYYDRGLEWYREQFRSAGAHHAVVGEVCQDYLFHPEAAGRIHRDLGRVKLMVTLREPASRAFSSYLYMLKHGEDVGSFREALATRPELLDHSRYGAALERYLRLFPRSDLHVALFDELQSDPQEFVDGVTTWLQVNRMTLDEQQLAARLPASEARSLSLARAARRAAEWTREHDGAALVGRVKRSRRIQNLLYRPIDRGSRVMAPEDAAFVWDQLDSDLDLVHELTGVEVRRAWATSVGDA